MESFCYKCIRENRICRCQHYALIKYPFFTKVNEDNIRVCYRCKHFIEDHFNDGNYIAYILSKYIYQIELFFQYVNKIMEQLCRMSLETTSTSLCPVQRIVSPSIPDLYQVSNINISICNFNLLNRSLVNVEYFIIKK